MLSSPIYTLPNFVSLIRILLAPVLLWAGVKGHSSVFLWGFAGSLLTDFLDGFLARLLNQQSKLGSQLDTVGDVLTGFVVIIGGWLLWPELVKAQAWWFLILMIMLATSGMVTLIKYRHLPSYHTWTAKLSTAVLGLGVWLLFSGLSPWLFRAGIIVLVISALEEIAITFILPAWRPNVPHVFRAISLRKLAEEK
ncbi:CDP-alcohol phosphatidyltransferase family protein [Kiritimatiellota bacterium B12222]|nr:CDP-alcohol phosphatidyltransferase family protein [Kiritimatiellota bacterium B12222]